MNELRDYVTFHSARLAARYARRRIPISTLYEAYFDGDLDIPGDMDAFLRRRNLFVAYRLTWKHLTWAVTRQAPAAMAAEAETVCSRYGFRTLKVKGGQRLDPSGSGTIAEFTLNGVDIAAKFSPAGKWLETETTIAAAALPKEVAAAIARDKASS